MKIIDSLNKIANNEEMPKKIKYKDKIYNFDYEDGDYFNNEDSEYLFSDLFERCYTKEFINDEIEILEEEKKIPEKLGKIEDNDGYIDQNDVIKIGKKVDEIIDYLKSKGE